MNIWKRMDFGNAHQIFVGQFLFLPTNPDFAYQHYSITPKASTCHEVQGAERVWLEWVKHSLTRSIAFCPFSNLHCASLSTGSSRPANWSSRHPLRPLPLSLQVPRCPSSQTLPCHLALKNSGSPVYLFTPVVPQDPISLEGSMRTKRIFLFCFSATHKDLNLNSSFSVL